MSGAPLPVPPSSTLWAQASKEWVIPAKPKPGRKQKKDEDAVSESRESMGSGRKTQNRAAQRAFRERKQSQLADLQSRIQSYEQGEIERNVALQVLSKRLKEENESLKKENSALKEELDKLRALLASRNLCARPMGGKRGREDDDVLDESNRMSSPKRFRARNPTSNVDDDLSASPIAYSQCSIPFSTASHTTIGGCAPMPRTSPSVNGSLQSTPHLHKKPLIARCDPHHQPSQLDAAKELALFPQDPHPNSLENPLSCPGPSLPSSHSSLFSDDSLVLDCGFCSSDTSCMCKELTRRGSSEIGSVITHCQDSSSIKSSGSILDNLPPYQPPVPLRSRKTGNTGSSLRQPTFFTASSIQQPVCSGDPSNCLACADDDFGKAFCTALGDSICSNALCSECPAKKFRLFPPETMVNQQMQSEGIARPQSQASGKALEILECCGKFGGICCTTAPLLPNSPISNSLIPPNSLTADESQDKTIPCNDAWLQLKSHPNIVFADLNLLANVVAGRARCTGPRIMSPSPTSPASLNSQGLSAGSLEQSRALPQDQNRSSTTSFNATSSSHPVLIPRDILLECGRKRILEVQAAGVKEALALLDGGVQRF